MTETRVEPSQAQPPLRPSQRHAQLEVDTFCTECGYNLHGQPVTRDERTGIFICRCPECGKFHPAGTGVAASSIWLSRMASLLLVVWVLFILHAIAWICVGLAAVQMAHITMFTYPAMVADDGRPVDWGVASTPESEGAGSATGSWGVVYRGTETAASSWRIVRSLEPPDETVRRGWTSLALLAGLGAGISLSSGILLVVFLWHWKRKHARLVMILPFLIAMLNLAIIYFDDGHRPVLGWATRWLMAHAALQAGFIWVGLLVGRPIARALLRMFIPPRPRQHFAFLWHADGKTLPVPPGVALR